MVQQQQQDTGLLAVELHFTLKGQMSWQGSLQSDFFLPLSMKQQQQQDTGPLAVALHFEWTKCPGRGRYDQTFGDFISQ